MLQKTLQCKARTIPYLNSIDIHFHKCDPRILGAQFLKVWGDHSAGSTPGCGEVHDDLYNGVVKILAESISMQMGPGTHRFVSCFLVD